MFLESSPSLSEQLRNTTIAPGRFELPSSDSKSEMLVHYTTGLRLLYFPINKNLSGLIVEKLLAQ